MDLGRLPNLNRELKESMVLIDIRWYCVSNSHPPEFCVAALAAGIAKSPVPLRNYFKITAFASRLLASVSTIANVAM